MRMRDSRLLHLVVGVLVAAAPGPLSGTSPQAGRVLVGEAEYHYLMADPGLPGTQALDSLEVARLWQLADDGYELETTMTGASWGDEFTLQGVSRLDPELHLTAIESSVEGGGSLIDSLMPSCAITPTEVRCRFGNDEAGVAVDGPADVFSLSFWTFVSAARRVPHEPGVEVALRFVMFDRGGPASALGGAAFDGTGRYLGRETIAADGAEITAHRIEIGSDLLPGMMVWLDDSSLPVAARMPASAQGGDEARFRVERVRYTPAR